MTMGRLQVFLATVVIAGPAVAQGVVGDASAGKAVALNLCAECHVVTKGQKPPELFKVPTFFEVAADPAITALSLRVFLQSSHTRMPNVILPPEKMGDVIAYILSLRGAGSETRAAPPSVLPHYVAAASVH